jgi:hypothetical protein
LIVNKLRGIVKVVAIKAPSFSEWTTAIWSWAVVDGVHFITSGLVLVCDII